MFGAIAGGIASALAGGAMSKLFGGGQKAASGGIQGDVLATDNNTFPPTATKEIQYLNAKGALTYTDIAGDPVLYGNLPPREISMKDVFRSGDSSKKFKIAEGQWYRYAP